MPERKVRGEPVPGRLPALVSEAQSFHPRHRAEGAGNYGVNGFDLLHGRRFSPFRDGTCATLGLPIVPEQGYPTSPDRAAIIPLVCRNQNAFRSREATA
jgi:hypothetical protein